MPRLNSRGQALCGVTELPVSVDRVIINPNGGGAQWLTDDVAIYQTNVDAGPNYPKGTTTGFYLETYNILTGARASVWPSDGTFIAAGGGRWIARNSGGVFGSLTVPDGGVRGAGTDGTLAIVRDYQEGLGFTMYALDGRVTEGPMEACYGFQVLGPTSAIWTVDGVIHALNARVPVAQAGHVHNPKRVVVRGEEWIVYWGDPGLIAHPYDSLTGYLIEATQQAYKHDYISLNGKIRVTYAYNAGELPDELRVVDLDLSAARTSFAGQSWVSRPGSAAVLDTRVTLTGDTTAASSVTANSALIQPQCGLLEDDIVYRLSLLAVNILQPLKVRYPNLIIKSGFRQVNTGIGQHEKGEAADIQLSEQTTETLYEMAYYIQQTLPFDQLVLNFTSKGDGKPWIHVSFSPTGLRGQVMTKDLADVFHDGLYVVTPYSGEEAAAKLREQQTADSLILSEITKLQNRQTKMTPSTVILDEVSQVSPGAVGGGTGGAGYGSTAGGYYGSGTGGVPNRSAVVDEIARETQNLHQRDAHAFTEAVARRLASESSRWGRKSRRGGPLSDDTVAYSVAGGVQVVDIILSAGTSSAETCWSVIDGGRVLPPEEADFWPVEPDGKRSPSAPTPGTGTDTGVGPIVNSTRDALVACINRQLDGVAAVDPFRVTLCVAWALQSEGAGLYMVTTAIPGGATYYEGNYYATNAICYPDGEAYEVVAGGSPTWRSIGKIENGSSYAPPIDPGPGSWLRCTL